MSHLKHKEYSDSIKCSLKKLVDHFDAEDRAVRERQLIQYRQMKLLWDGFSQLWFSRVAHDWRIWDANLEENDNDQYYYDKPINVFRAYLESIIAALSSVVPPIKCYPDNADDILDVDTAKAGDKIAQLVMRHNGSSLLWLHILFIYCTEGMTAIYSYPKQDKEYGTYKKENYEEVEEIQSKLLCPTCGMELDAEFTDELRDKYGVNNDDVILQNFILNDDIEFCSQCAVKIQPSLKREKVIVTKLTGVTEEPKTRICMEAYGGLYIKVPTYAMKQSDCLYLSYCYETHFANILEKYPHLYGQIHDGENNKADGATGVYSTYEQWARLSTQYRGEYPINNRTVRNFWFRPASYYILDEDELDELKKNFPNGVKAVFINEIFADAVNENLDDYWTLTYNPLSDYLQHDPLGLLLVSVQEITNDLISLTLQTIEHGIGQTFVDPSVLNLNQYRQTEVLPGGVYPAVPKTGKSLADGFHQLKTATLSQEVLPFGQQIQSLGQLTTGALPSLFGGQMNESKTASEYSMSRAQALQRLQNTWKMLTEAWKQSFSKVIPMFINIVQEDERWVEKDKAGNFINVFIRKSELSGKIGKVELEANENLPMTWNQRKDIIMQLLQAGNPQILEIIGSPENLPVIRDAIGLVDFFVPGEDDRNKQFEEIQQLVNSEPIVIPPKLDPMALQFGAEQGMPITPEIQQMTMPQELPSVEIDPQIDNHQIEFEICRAWLISDAGRQSKIDNPAGYKNVMLHAMQHLQQVQIAQQNMMLQQAQGAVPGEKAKEDTKAPIKGESDVRTEQ